MPYYRETADYHTESRTPWYPPTTPKAAIKQNNLLRRSSLICYREREQLMQQIESEKYNLYLQNHP